MGKKIHHPKANVVAMGFIVFPRVSKSAHQSHDLKKRPKITQPDCSGHYFFLVSLAGALAGAFVSALGSVEAAAAVAAASASGAEMVAMVKLTLDL